MRPAINRLYRAPEKAVVAELLSYIQLSEGQNKRIDDLARLLVKSVRQSYLTKPAVDKLMTKYELSSQEGLALMGLAESLIRVPDQSTAYALIQDKLRGVSFDAEISATESWIEKTVGKVLGFATSFLSKSDHSVLGPLKSSMQTMSKPVVTFTARKILNQLANQFVMGATIADAYKEVPENLKKGYRHTFDMLGEAAHTKADADRYFHNYLNAIKDIGAREEQLLGEHARRPHRSSISVKLSALHPRYDVAHGDTCVPELVKSLKLLCLEAKTQNIDLTVDAEESWRLELSLAIFEQVAKDPDLADWDGLGLAVQAYQKRAMDVLDYLHDLAKTTNRQLKIRLVKGAYWDTEIKQAQVSGVTNYPVFTRKQATDLSYLACAKKLLSDPTYFCPKFATHNAHTVAAIIELANGAKHYEFQCLYGMGQDLYEEVLKDDFAITKGIPVRIYAPVGEFRDLLPYLVRRLLENGANTSFVNEITKENLSISDLIADPIAFMRSLEPHQIPNPYISFPSGILPGRKNSLGLDITDAKDLNLILDGQGKTEALVKTRKLLGHPLIDGKPVKSGDGIEAFNPATGEGIGRLYTADKDHLSSAITGAHEAYFAWSHTPVKIRAKILDDIADAFEAQMTDLMGILSIEAGKSISDGIAEVREAVDFCRYYANEARAKFTRPIDLPGPTGEKNQLMYAGRGVFLCISPWNFPLAIFTGQIVAALVAGNTVIAKPASQTSIIATRAVEIMHGILHNAGMSKSVLQLIPSSGRVLGDHILPDARVAGVCFTGSTDTAKEINQTLATRHGSIVPFIAETGGQNAMIVDSTALPEQVVTDVIASAFQSAGQRCSALRLLCLQEEVAESVMTMLKGAMDDLVVGDPRRLQTDVGPVIDSVAKEALMAHQKDLESYAQHIHTSPLSKDLLKQGHYVAPMAYELKDLSKLTEEHFGPILHIIRFKTSDLSKLISDINALGFGLTFGLHSRIQSRVEDISQQIGAGNIYVNRNMIGAVVGVQPFGGQGLSGTGPKAGGPNYLMRFVHEKTVSINTTAQGGNTSLMSLGK